jgi:hypothetical protein
VRFSFKSDDDRSWPSDGKGKAAAAVAAGGAQQPPSGFVQDRFAISFFLDPSPTDAAYSFIRNANCKTTAPFSLSVFCPLSAFRLIPKAHTRSCGTVTALLGANHPTVSTCAGSP